MDFQADSSENARPPRVVESLPDWLTIVRTQVESLKFGTVQITVQDSRVVQIERNEKTRLDRFH